MTTFKEWIIFVVERVYGSSKYNVNYMSHAALVQVSPCVYSGAVDWREYGKSLFLTEAERASVRSTIANNSLWAERSDTACVSLFGGVSGGGLRYEYLSATYDFVSDAWRPSVLTTSQRANRPPSDSATYRRGQRGG